MKPTLNSPVNSSETPNTKICSVCGDRALGYNFNAITCESCKAFFRRNALLSKEFTCPFNQNCEITVVTRRFCQKCRLAKCFAIGMKKEYIMSEEDKQEKRRKIEANRAKKRGRSGDEASPRPVKIKRECPTAMESSSDGEAWSSVSSTPAPRVAEDAVVVDSAVDFPLPPVSVASVESKVKLESSQVQVLEQVLTPAQAQTPLPFEDERSPAEIVDQIIQVPEQASQVINQVMRTQKETVAVMTKVIQSPTDALRLINHFISQPGDALQLISKIMNSPLDALNVFIQFMSSPTDALQIISKILSSPNDVLLFIEQLMQNPEDGIDIMEKFMNDPAEALKMINKMMEENSSGSTAVETNTEGKSEQEILRQSVEGNMIKSILDTNNVESHKVLIAPPSRSANINRSPLGFPSTSRTGHCEGAEAMNGGVGVTVGGEPPRDVAKDILEEVENKAIQPNSIESVICEVIKLEYDCFNLLSTIGPSSRELNDAERAKLNELIVAHKVLYAPLDEDLNSEECRIKLNQNQQNPQLLPVINLTAIAIRRLIKMSKKISAFKNMCQEDQFALMKGGCVQMMLLRSVMQYDCDRATWKIPHNHKEMSNIKADVLKLAKGNVYQEYEQFIRTFDKKWRMDENIILIMCAIILFTPTRPWTVHGDVIKLEQNSYYYLLRRYLESVYPGCEAKSTFLKLIQKIAELHRLNEEVVNVYLDANPAEVEPLLREIFDLKVNKN